MLQNYIKIAFRNLIKHKAFSIINIIGLSIGISACVLLALYISDEFSYEKHFNDPERIYRIVSTFHKDDGTSETFPRTSPPVAMTMLAEFPELQSATRVVSPPEVEQHLIKFEDKTFYEKKGLLVDSTFFDVFSYTFREGDPGTALDAPSTVVLSDKLAKKLFSDESAIDHLIAINSGAFTDTFRITGVLKAYTSNSHLNADFYMCMNSKGWGSYINTVTTWSGQNFIVSYLKLKPGTTQAGVEAKFPSLMEKYGAKDLKEMGLKKSMFLQPLLDIRLFSNFRNSFGMDNSGSSITKLYIMGSIGLFILLIACINFMNLTTAKASQRAGEVGVRKTLGANRKNLITQFLGESMSIVFIAMILVIAIVQLLLPVFNSMTQKELSIGAENVTYFIAAVLIITLITGLVAGSYPALFLSSFQPAKVLKDKRLGGGGSNWLRKSLVVFQFIISISLISAILIIQKQMRFVQQQSLGFIPEYKIMIPLRTLESKSNYTKFKTSLKQIVGVNDVAAGTSLPSTNTFRDLPLYPDGSNMEKSHLHFNIQVDEDYFKSLGIRLIAGRNLSQTSDTASFTSERSARVIVNRESLKVNGLTAENAIGQKLHVDWQGRTISFEIVGVVDDYHHNSFHRSISPFMFSIPQSMNDFVYSIVSVDAANYNAVASQIEKSWKELSPDTPFESEFLSESIKKEYEADRRDNMVISVSTILAIIISCLGLYGLSIHVAERKVKEIGIRKVMGASVFTIIRMLSKDFILLIFIAILIAIPISYAAMNWWLEKFAYKIEIGMLEFAIAAFITLAITWLTVGFESVKAAVQNPINSLRIE